MVIAMLNANYGRVAGRVLAPPRASRVAPPAVAKVTRALPPLGAALPEATAAAVDALTGG